VTITESGGSTDVAEGGATDSYEVVLNAQPSADVTISIDPNAQLDLGFGVGNPLSLVFTSGNWDTPQSVTVSAVDDAVVEGPHTGAITHSASSSDGNYDGISISGVTVNITDNDVPVVPGVTITESGGSTDVAEGGALDSYEVVLNTQPSAAVTVTTSPDAQTIVSPTIMVFNSGDWDTPQTAFLFAVDDDVAEGSHTGTISHSASSADGDYDGISIADVTVNITDNEQAFSYMPLALVNHVVAPDLVITSLVVSSDNVTLVIENQGDAPVTDEFWVDVYVNPSSTPEVNQYWSLIASQGMVWGVTADTLGSLAPGGALTLTLNDAFYQPDWSSVSWPLDAGATVYAQADSYGDHAFGAVQENHEVIGGAYNNVAVTSLAATLSANGSERPVWPRANRR